MLSIVCMQGQVVLILYVNDVVVLCLCMLDWTPMHIKLCFVFVYSMNVVRCFSHIFS